MILKCQKSVIYTFSFTLNVYFGYIFQDIYCILENTTDDICKYLIYTQLFAYISL